MNYFELYEIRIAFEIDGPLLKKKFYELSRQYHPDYHANESQEKQKKNLELSTLINKAYQTLSSPIKRIEYILTLFQVIVDSDQYKLPQDFLIEMMDINEALLELQNESDSTDLAFLSKQVQSIEEKISTELKTYMYHFDSKENTEDQENILLKIKDIWYRQKYLLRIRDSLNKFATR